MTNNARERPISDGVMPSVSNMTPRELALFLAVQHHAAACYAKVQMTPASKDTVLNTAKFFLAWINLVDSTPVNRSEQATG